jgi:1,4-dihydroxy-2-naphthoyl-CoA hydrolase
MVRELMPLAGTLGVVLLAYSPREVVARLPWAPQVCTAGGVLHGGAIMALADTSGAACAFLNLPEGAAGTTTIESKTNFLRAVTRGFAQTRSVPLHVGRTVIVVETDVTDETDRLVAKTVQSQLVLSRS